MKYKNLLWLLVAYNFSVLSYSAAENNILLIINYNHAYYDSIPFLRELYEPAFSNIVFYGPEKHDDVIQVHHHKGWFGYMDIADAMQRFPGYDGYFFVSDDVVINHWNLERFDASKIWAAYPAVQNYPFDPAKDGWNWWKKDIGYQALEKTLHELPEKYLEQLAASLGSNKICKGYSDAVYFPACYKEDVIALCAIFTKNRLFLEVAMPMMCACLEHPAISEKLNIRYLRWDDRKHYKRLYNHSIDGLHPIKFSSNDARSFVQQQFAKRLTATDKCGACQP